MTSAPNQEKIVEPQSFSFLRSAVSCSPISEAEFRAATQEGMETAVPHVVTVAVLHCVGVTGTIENFRRSQSLQGQIRAIQNRRDVSSQIKRRAIKPLENELDTHKKATNQYAAALGEVETQSEAFEEQYMPDGKVNITALDALYDRTDTHPAVDAIAALRLFAKADKQRDLVVRADRLLRFMINQTAGSQNPVQ